MSVHIIFGAGLRGSLERAGLALKAYKSGDTFVAVGRYSAGDMYPPPNEDRWECNLIRSYLLDRAVPTEDIKVVPTSETTSQNMQALLSSGRFAAKDAIIYCARAQTVVIKTFLRLERLPYPTFCYTAKDYPWKMRVFYYLQTLGARSTYQVLWRERRLVFLFRLVKHNKQMRKKL